MFGFLVNEREVLNFTVVILTIAAYGLYRLWKPNAPRHHKRFAIAALLLTFAATGVYSYLRSIWTAPHHDTGLHFQWWALHALIGYGLYRLVQRAPERFRTTIAVVIVLLLFSILTVFGYAVHTTYKRSLAPPPSAASKQESNRTQLHMSPSPCFMPPPSLLAHFFPPRDTPECRRLHPQPSDKSE